MCVDVRRHVPPDACCTSPSASGHGSVLTLTLCAPQAIDAVRYYLGRRNLAKKTLVDERFLI